jgi:hypothetical protein
MGDARHHYTIMVEPDLLNASRYRWMLCEGCRIALRSCGSCQSAEEAFAEAERVGRKQEVARTSRERERLT